MANFTQNMIWNQNIFPDGLICIFPGLLLLEQLGGMMFVHRTWEMLSPGRGWVFMNRIFWLVQVDQQKLCSLREALEMGQNRAMHETSLICGSKETETVLVSTNLFHSLAIPLQKRNIYDQGVVTDAFFPLLLFQTSFRKTKAELRHLFISSKVWHCPCTAHPKGCIPLPCLVKEV